MCTTGVTDSRPGAAERHELTTAILVPVLDRSHRIEPLLANIVAATPEPHHIIFAASDQPTINELDRLGGEFLQDHGDTWPNRINRLFAATTEPYVFLAADDVRFHPGWLTAAHETMRGVDGVVLVNDLHNPNGTLALVSRAYVERDGGTMDGTGLLIHPGYAHNWSDSELIAVAKARGRHAYCPESVVEHLHPCAGKGEPDATYAKGLATEQRDRELFLSRGWMWTQARPPFSSMSGTA